MYNITSSLPSRRPVTPRACGTRKKAPGRTVYEVRKRLIHKIRQRAAFSRVTSVLRTLPVPPVRWPRAVSQPHDFLEIGNFAPFSEFLHINGRHFPDFFRRFF